MFSWIGHYVVEVCALPSAPLVLHCTGLDIHSGSILVDAVNYMKDWALRKEEVRLLQRTEMQILRGQEGAQQLGILVKRYERHV